jgi:hypothetical protein
MSANSQIQVSKSLEEKIQAAVSVHEIQALLHQAAQDQHLIEPHSWDSNGSDYFGMRTVEPPVAQGFAKSLVIDGVKHIIEGATEQELVANELQLMRTLFSGTAATTQARDDAGRFVTQQESIEAEARRIAEMGLNTVSDIESDLVTRALAARGISMATLQRVEHQHVTQSWASAVEEFKQGAGQDWLGGENMNIAVRLIEENGLTDKPTAETLAAVWQHMKENGLAVENTELTQAQERAKAINSATSYEDLKAAVGYRDPEPRSSGVWRR